MTERMRTCGEGFGSGLGLQELYKDIQIRRHDFDEAGINWNRKCAFLDFRLFFGIYGSIAFLVVYVLLKCGSGMAYRRICNRDCADALDNGVVKWGMNSLESEPRADPNTNKKLKKLSFIVLFHLLYFLFLFLNFCI